MKSKIILLPVILTLLSTASFAQKQSAGAFVEAFYKYLRTRSGIFNAAEVNLRKRWFTAEMNNLFLNELKHEKEYLKKNPTDKPRFGDGLTFEPLNECYKAGKTYDHLYKIGAPSVVDGKTIVEVKFSNPKICGGDYIDTYKIELVKNKGAWLISDFIYSEGNRLTENLKMKY